jgi:hypothetical protein
MHALHHRSEIIPPGTCLFGKKWHEWEKFSQSGKKEHADCRLRDD